MKSFFPRPTQQAQAWVKSLVSAGDVVVDATLGNGHDALFLAQLVGPTGKVFGFDVQAAALEQSRRLLENDGIEASRFQWLLASHASMSQSITQPVKAVMFNLGYLPGADHDCITQTQETLRALSAALELLDEGGILTVICYPGHLGGDEEALAVRDWADAQGDRCEVMICEKRATKNPAPFLIGLYRKGGDR